jgi:flagellin
MTTINTNVSSLIAKNAIGQNERAMSQAMTRLSTGSRINSARDDAAGLAISERMSSQVSGLNMAARNANDAISLLQTAEGATKEIASMLGRMRELAVQSASDTYTSTDRAALNLEYQELLTEMDRVAETTEWNGDKILAGAVSTVTTNLADSKSIAIQVGAGASQTMALTINSWRPTVAVDGSMSVDGTGKSGVDDQAPENTVVTFSASSQAADKTLALGGLIATITGGTNPTAAQFATLFANLEDGATSGAALSGIAWSGALSGFSTGPSVASSKVTFTSTGTSTSNNTLNVTDLAETDVTNYAALVTTAGTKANQSAYGAGILYAGGNPQDSTPLAPTALNITSAANASAAITEVDAAINGAAAERAKYGAYMSRLQHASDNLTNVATNTAASRSQIADADYASETTELARTQIISQASTAMLAQANQVKQTVLALLK